MVSECTLSDIYSNLPLIEEVLIVQLETIGPQEYMNLSAIKEEVIFQAERHRVNLTAEDEAQNVRADNLLNLHNLTPSRSINLPVSFDGIGGHKGGVECHATPDSKIHQPIKAEIPETPWSVEGNYGSRQEIDDVRTTPGMTPRGPMESDDRGSNGTNNSCMKSPVLSQVEPVYDGEPLVVEVHQTPKMDYYESENKNPAPNEETLTQVSCSINHKARFFHPGIKMMYLRLLVASVEKAVKSVIPATFVARLRQNFA